MTGDDDLDGAVSVEEWLGRALAGEPGPGPAAALSSTDLGLVAKVDLIEGDDQHVRPVDYKRGSPPNTVDRTPVAALPLVSARTLVTAGSRTLSTK